MAGIAEAIAGVSKLASQLWRYFKGDQTREEFTLQEQAQGHQDTFVKAWEDGDHEAATKAFDQLRRVRDQLAAMRRREG